MLNSGFRLLNPTVNANLSSYGCRSLLVCLPVVNFLLLSRQIMLQFQMPLQENCRGKIECRQHFPTAQRPHEGAEWKYHGTRSSVTDS